MMIMDNELERILKEAVVAYLKLLGISQHLPGGTEGNHERN
jgi:hypothetical protein